MDIATPEFIDNVNKTLCQSLKDDIKPGSKLSVAAACFSIYAYQELQNELKDINELRFIFTSPTFVAEKAKKEKREFYIPRLNRERSLYGTEFEVKLRNELNQKAIAKECAEWIKKKATFKSNSTQQNMPCFMNVDGTSYSPVKEFTAVELGVEKGNNAAFAITKMQAPMSASFLQMFEQFWQNKEMMQDITDQIIEGIASAYNENAPEFIYFFTLYNIFNEFLEDISEDILPNEATGFKNSVIWSKLYNFQKDACLAIINKLEKYNGCILADSVGLGKTFTALAVIKYYETRNKNVLVLCPKKLSDNWNTYRDNYTNNPLVDDRLNYKVLYHTDIGRAKGFSNGTDLGRLRWDTYDLVVIDESHNFRNGGKLEPEEDEKLNRYAILLKDVIRKGVHTKVLMLSATPVNNRFNDLKNQLRLAYEGNSVNLDEKLNTTRPIDEIFRQAQTAFNTWSKWNPEDRTTANLLKMLDFDFFEVLDSVTIARSRKHIEKYYDTSSIGKFPTRLPPISLRPNLTDLKGAIGYNQIFEELVKLNLDIYRPSHYILPSRMNKYEELFQDNKVNIGFTQANREIGIRRLMAINLMKRMESSIYSFDLTLQRIKDLIGETLSKINLYEQNKKSNVFDFDEFTNEDEYDADDANSDLFSFGTKAVRISLEDMDYISWRKKLEDDEDVLELLILLVKDITPEHDLKLQELLKVIKNKIENPINEGNKKIIIFSAFADTAFYLYDNVSEYAKRNFGLDTAIITGTANGKCTTKLSRNDLTTILTCFSPKSKDKALVMPNENANIDILIATDCISEGQNLQDCDYLINYDIHWNPVRIIQRFGRIDRIGSKNEKIQLVNFWPNITLDEYINLKSKVETRMKIVDMTATGDYNILSDEEKQDLEYRKAQLQKLQEEVCDMEEMTEGISIMDLGLNEFRLDLLDYVKEHGDLDSTPFGLHAVTLAKEDCPPGVIYVLKNRNNNVNIDNQNRLHPFYMVYIGEDGEIVCNHLNPKNMLDKMRFMTKGKSEPMPEVYRRFNTETKDGRNMKFYNRLLCDSISSIIEVKEESDMDSFLGGQEVDFKRGQIKGLDDFELICFLVIKEAKNA
jgi:SNF2 family DNA or RNA helicase